ncbi:hypothetical protein BC628DRAFT_892186 [Trametes gibbosa]|nr:hypothetical protein BC628DRAFT_892186 [Trametes gibbosa]
MHGRAGSLSVLRVARRLPPLSSHPVQSLPYMGSYFGHMLARTWSSTASTREHAAYVECSLSTCSTLRMAAPRSHPAFLDLPPELRLAVYESFLTAHLRIRQNSQPSNAHRRLLHACRQIRDEAGPILRRYVSLLHEHQIHAFLRHAHPSACAQVQWADVANDGRVFHGAQTDEKEDSPLSALHAALGRMTALARLRVFHCRQGLPLDLQSTMSLHRTRRLGLRFERAMFPQHAPALCMYELHLSPETRVELFDALPPRALLSLRLSGEIVAPPAPHRPTPALRSLTLHGVSGNVFDRHTVEQCFPRARLTSFAYAHAHRLAFEIRNHHLESLAGAHRAHLRVLVLLGCSRLSSAVLSRCLEGLPALEHLALDLVTVDELRSNFVLALPPRLAVFKLQVINAWYAVPLAEGERGLCDAVESRVLLREPPYEQVCVCFRTQLMSEGGRGERWERIAKDHRVRLEIGPWGPRLMTEL